MTQTKPIRRRWRIPPPIRPAHTEGLGLLGELPEPVGLVVWRTARAVILWCETPPPARGALFVAGHRERRESEIRESVADAALAAPLAALAAVLDPKHPPTPEQVAAACGEIAQWAETAGAATTRHDFLYAASLAAPGDPRWALALGRLYRDGGDTPRADAWLQRALGLARQVGDREVQVRSHVALGRMWIVRGGFPTARRHLRRAVRLCYEHRVRGEARAFAHHDSYVVELERGNWSTAARHAAAALRAYGPTHPWAPVMLMDVACMWTEQGYFDAAVHALAEVLPRMQRDRPDRVVDTYANLARAAGGQGDAVRFREAADAALAAIRGPQPPPLVAGALLQIARGAASLGLCDQAIALATEAAERADQRGQAQIAFGARAVLEGAQGEHAARTQSPAASRGEEAERGAAEALSTSRQFTAYLVPRPASAAGVA